MKTLLAFVLVSVTSLNVAYAQVEIDDLRAPTSPAFVLLDVTPASVERPDNPKAFTVNLINTISNAHGLPQNYALEVAPYWLSYHPDLTFEKYQSPGAMSIVQTLAISVATTPMLPAGSTTGDPIGTHVGIGVRTNLRNGRFHPKLPGLVSELGNLQGNELTAIANASKAEDAVATAQDALTKALNAGLPGDAEQKALTARQSELAVLTKKAEDIEAERKAKALEIQALDTERLGLIVSLAAGKVWDFPLDDVAQSQPGRWGVWLTPSYRFRACTSDGDSCSASLDAVAVLRALRDPGKDTAWDAGGRLLWQPTKELTVSGEVLHRWGGDSDTAAGTDSNRTTGMLEYEIRKDLSVYATFGKDFEKETGRKPLVTLLGLNVGLGKSPTVKAK